MSNEQAGKYLSFTEFEEMMVQILETRNPDKKVVIQNIKKNNDLNLTGVSIVEDDNGVYATVYLNNYYYEHMSRRITTEQLNTIAGEIEKLARENKIDSSKEIVENFTNFDLVKNNIVFQLVNTELNKELLKNTPHRDFYDLAIIYKVMLNDALGEGSGMATVLIKNNHMKIWDLTEESLYELAMKNTPDLLKPDFVEMGSVLKQMMDEDERVSEMVDEVDLLMYVLTNERKLGGAATILYPGLLEHIYRGLGHKFFVIPSSIHETIIMFTDDEEVRQEDKDHINAMIEEVNKTQVAQEEILGKHAYFYNGAELEICY